MTDFASAHATGGRHAEVAKECANKLGDTSRHTLGFVYVTTQLNGGFGEILTTLKRETGVQTWVGTAGMGVCSSGTAYFDEPAVAAMTCRLPSSAFRLLSPVRVGHVARSLAPDALATIGIVHADPRNSNLTDLVATIARSRGAYLVGGLSVGSGIHPQAIGNHVVDGGISGVFIGGPGAPEVSVGLTQDSVPIGKVHTVTKGGGRVIVELDRRPAFEVLREDAGAAEGDDPRLWLENVHPALPIAGSDWTSHVVRNLVGIDPTLGRVTLGDTIKPDDQVVFVRRGRATGERDLARMLGSVTARAKAPKAALYYSCVTRGPKRFESKAYEIEVLRASLGDIPMVGLFGNGQIANDRIYGYAGVLTIFS